VRNQKAREKLFLSYLAPRHMFISISHVSGAIATQRASATSQRLSLTLGRGRRGGRGRRQGVARGRRDPVHRCDTPPLLRRGVPVPPAAPHQRLPLRLRDCPPRPRLPHAGPPPPRPRCRMQARRPAPAECLEMSGAEDAIKSAAKSDSVCYKRLSSPATALPQPRPAAPPLLPDARTVRGAIAGAGSGGRRGARRPPHPARLIQSRPRGRRTRWRSCTTRRSPTPRYSSLLLWSMRGREGGRFAWASVCERVRLRACVRAAAGAAAQGAPGPAPAVVAVQAHRHPVNRPPPACKALTFLAKRLTSLHNA
jgi:hypothetical protein